MLKSIVFLISVIYAYAMNSGVYGFGTDFIKVYSNGNAVYGGYVDRIGWLIATMEIEGFHIGIFLTSFLVANSSLKLYVYFTQRVLNKRIRLLSLFVIAGLLLHTWPIVMSTSNVMRQGIMMSFLYYSLVAADQKHNKLAVFYAILTFFSHKSGLLFLVILALTLTFRNPKLQRTNPFFRILIILSVFLLSRLFFSPGKEMIIGYDFSVMFLFAGLLSLGLLTSIRHHKTSLIEGYVYTFLIASPVLFFIVSIYQYERIWMVNLLLVMIVLLGCVKKSQSTLLAILEFGPLVAMTYATGMFSAGLT